MDTVLLRKMSFKSTFTFGKYTGMSVQQVLDLKHTAYIRYVYFNIGGISFVDEILELVGVFNSKVGFDYRIIKPGTNPEIGKSISENKSGYISKKGLEIVKLDNKRRIGSFIKRDKIFYSKGNLQRANHGR